VGDPRREGPAEEVYELARLMGSQGITTATAGSDSRAAVMAVYAAATAISLGLRTVILDAGDDEVLRDLDAFAEDAAARFKEELPPMRTSVEVSGA
jgi:hypothetical protein